LLVKYSWNEDKVKKEKIEEEQIFDEDARITLKARRSQRLLATKPYEDEEEEEEMTFNIWKLLLNEKRSDWIVYVPGQEKNFNSIFDVIKKTLPLTDMQRHPKNKKIFTFQLSDRSHLSSLLKKLKKKNISA